MSGHTWGCNQTSIFIHLLNHHLPWLISLIKCRNMLEMRARVFPTLFNYYTQIMHNDGFHCDMSFMCIMYFDHVYLIALCCPPLTPALYFLVFFFSSLSHWVLLQFLTGDILLVDKPLKKHFSPPQQPLIAKAPHGGPSIGSPSQGLESWAAALWEFVSNPWPWDLLCTRYMRLCCGGHLPHNCESLEFASMWNTRHSI